MVDDFNKDYSQEAEDDSCDLDPSKLCNSCGKCLDDQNEDYKVVRIDGIVKDEKIGLDLDEYILEDETLKDDSENIENQIFDVEYLEDIPELNKEYEEKVDKLLGRK